LAAEPGSAKTIVKILLFANTSWYLYNFRLPLAEALRSAGHEVILVSPSDDYSQKLTDAGFMWIDFPLSRKGRNPFFEVVTLFRLITLYRNAKPDLVHHFTIKCVVYGSLAARWTGIKSVINAITGLGYVFIGNSKSQTILRWLIILLYRFSLKGTRVVFQNEDDLRQFLEYTLVDRDQSEIIRGSGVDIQRFTVSPFPEGMPVVVLPARMLWDKGVAEFVSAARQLRKEGIIARFILAGDTDDDNPAAVPNKTLKGWQKEGIVEWMGWQSDMPSVYATSTIVCLPSYREGLPKTLIEAAACGRPLIATDVPGCREVIIPGKTGLLSVVRDVETLTNCLRAMIQDRDSWYRMGQEARKLAEDEFSTGRIINETMQIYSKLQVDGTSR
jgi:glycosyltransferase involved in cell wall biosynthesis